MIPKKLHMRNFMCYHEPDPLDFSGIHLACIAGDNGHGKSALLDAMTWAVWGKARARSDDELVRSGETEMEVEFEFLLGDDSYRVIRKREKRRRSLGALDLQIKDGEGYRSIAGATQQETQHQINQLLHSDYALFTNSVLLVQGRADEFTIKPPAERKRILADILGLSVYDTYEQRAKDLAREKEQAFAVTQLRIQEIDAELVHREEYEQEKLRAQEDVSQLGAQLREAERRLRDLGERAKVLETQKAQLMDLERRIKSTREQLRSVEKRTSDYQDKVRTTQQVLGRKGQIEADHARLLQVGQRDAELGQRLSQLMALTEERQAIERRIAAVRSELDLEERVTAHRVEELTRIEQELPSWQNEQAKAATEAATLQVLAADAESVRFQVQEWTAQVADLRARQEPLKDEMQRLKDNLDLIRQPIGVCPLCRQDLTEEHRQRLFEDVESRGKELGDLYRENEASLRSLLERMSAAKTQLERADRDLKRKPAVDRLEADWSHRVNQATEAIAPLQELRDRLLAIRQRRDDRDYAHDDHRALAALEDQVRVLSYDRAEHEGLRQEMAQLGQVEGEWNALTTAEHALSEWHTALEQLAQSAMELREALRQDQQVEATLLTCLEEHPGLVQRLDQAAGEVDGLRSREGRSRQVLGAAQQKLDYCRHLATERQTRSQSLVTLAEERSLYEELQLAFGKKGLQALLIETAIPEIEEEANSLLARLTEGRMNVSFDTQRDTRAGSTIETLDIKISDELGMRSYELYSGGEAFRVNLAIRIALSKLLARRAGAQLQTLIIDEGFGTQDAEGRQRLVEAIHSIQGDFALILVITHIDELKDAFPVRIDVVKTGDGAQISIN